MTSLLYAQDGFSLHVLHVATSRSSTRFVLLPSFEAPEISWCWRPFTEQTGLLCSGWYYFPEGHLKRQISSFLFLTRCCGHAATWVHQYLNEHLSCSISLLNPSFRPDFVIGMGCYLNAGWFASELWSGGWSKVDFLSERKACSSRQIWIISHID